MGLMKKLTSVVVTAGLLVGLVGTAFAATPSDIDTAADRMKALGVIKGDENGDLKLNSSITRAELVTIIVRAFGKEKDAALLKGAPVYPDTASHWASGEIAMAKAIIEGNGFSMGMPDGTFAPQGSVTAAQAVAFLMKFLGVPADTTQAWPNDYLGGAVAAGLITADEQVELAAAGDAQRGLVFYLADKAFSGYKLADGKTMYTKYVDPVAPTVDLDAVASPTTEAKVTVTGTVSSDATAVYLGTTPVQVVGGKFSAEVELALGEQEITVTATDLAGHVVTDSIKVTRTVGAAASIEVASDLTVAAGESAPLAVAVKDATGNVISDAPVAVSESTLGTYAGGVFTAGTKVGTGTITVTSGDLSKTVNVTVTAGALAKVEAKDASVAPGKATTLVATDAYGNTIAGATFAQSSADAMVDAANGTFVAFKAGTYTVTATKDGKTVEGKVGVYGAVKKLVVSAPATMVANNKTEVKVTVTAVDANGNVVADVEGNAVFDADNELALGKDQAAQVEFENGVATFKVKAPVDLADAETDLVFTWTNPDDAEDEAEGYATVVVDPQVATSIKVSADEEYLPTDSTTTPLPVTVKILDQAGVAMVEGAYDVKVVVTGPAMLDNDKAEGTYTIDPENDTVDLFASEVGEAGNITVTASFAGLTSGTLSLKAAFPQAAKLIKVAADDEASATVSDDGSEYVKYNVTVTDKNGVPVTGDYTLNVSFKGLEDDTLTYFTTSVDGDGEPNNWDDIKTGTEQVVIDDSHKGSFFLYGEVADTFTFTVKDANEELTAAAAQEVTLNAGDPTYIALETDTLYVLRGENASATVKAQIYDEFGNKVKLAGVKVTFADESGDYDGVLLDGKAEDVEVTTDANGVASITVSLKSFVTGAVNITVTEGEDVDGDAVNLAPAQDWAIGGTPIRATVLTLVNAIADEMTAAIVDNTDLTTRKPSVGAGTPVALKLTVKDNFGRPMTNLTADDIEVTTSNDDLDVTVEGHFDIGEAEDGIYYVTDITPEKAEMLTLTAKIRTVAAEIKASKSINIKAGNPDKVIIAEAEDDELTIEAKKERILTLKVVDEFGNPVTSTQVGENVVVTLSTTDNGNYSFRDMDNITLPLAEGEVDVYTITIPGGRNSKQFKFVTDTDDSEAYTITVSSSSTMSWDNGADDFEGTAQVIDVNP